MQNYYNATYDNHSADSLELVKHHLRHEWCYIQSNEMRRRHLLSNNRIYCYRNGKAVSYCEAFEKNGTLRFTKTMRLK